MSLLRSAVPLFKVRHEIDERDNAVFRHSVVDAGAHAAHGAMALQIGQSGTLGLGGALSGDLLFWGTPGATYHVALYIGSGQMIEAQKTGTFVHVIAVWGAPSLIRRIFPATGATWVLPGATVRLQVAGQGGVPTSGASAVALNVTAVSPTAAGYLIVYGSSDTRPTASNLNFVRGQTIPNLVLSRIGADGTVLLYNGSAGSVHLVVDVSGYYRL